MTRSILLLAALVACKTPKPVVTAPPPPDKDVVVTDEDEPKKQVPEEPVMPPEPPKPEIPKMAAMQTAQPQELAFPNEEFRKKQPAPGTVRDFKFPKMKKFALANGIEVYLVEQHALPIVSMQLEIDGGSALDPKGKEGLAAVCATMLTEGTEKLDKVAYSEAQADLASSISAGASDDAITVSLSSLTKYLDQTFDLFAATIRTPGFRASDFDRMIKRRLEALKQARSSPATIPNRVSGPILYGAEHPLGTVTTEASLKSITLDDCKAFAKATLLPKGARLFVVGDRTEAQIRAQFAKLKDWSGAAPTPPKLATPATMKGKIFFVDVPGAVQSQVWALGFGPQRTEPDYLETSILGSVFGGGFASRINMNLREDKGYSYGARGGFGYSKNYGTFMASTQVRADATYQTLLEIDREVKALASNATPANSTEVEREKVGVTLALPGRFATAAAALGQYRQLVYFGLPLDYFDSFVAKVAKVTEATVAAAAQKHLHPNDMVYLVVGDGTTKLVVHDPKAAKDAPIEKRNPPYMKDGKQLTLRQALVDLATRGDVGTGGFVELDPDGVVRGRGP